MAGRSRLLLTLVALLITSWSDLLRADEDASNPALVPPAPLHEQVLHRAGDPDRPVDLMVTLYTPVGPGRFPLAVMNHGRSDSGAQRAAAPRYRFTMSAYYFLSRGYAVALPMMRVCRLRRQAGPLRLRPRPPGDGSGTRHRSRHR